MTRRGLFRDVHSPQSLDELRSLAVIFLQVIAQVRDFGLQPPNILSLQA